MITKPKSLSLLTSELDIHFALFIKLRDADANGTITCFVSGERVFWRDSEAAHWQKRAHMGTRWNEKNVHACTVESNRFDPEHDKKYTSRMMTKYGMPMCAVIQRLALSLQKWTRPELEEKIEYYKSEVARLKKEKGL